MKTFIWIVFASNGAVSKVFSNEKSAWDYAEKNATDGYCLSVESHEVLTPEVDEMAKIWTDVINGS